MIARSSDSRQELVERRGRARAPAGGRGRVHLRRSLIGGGLWAPTTSATVEVDADSALSPAAGGRRIVRARRAHQVIVLARRARRHRARPFILGGLVIDFRLHARPRLVCRQRSANGIAAKAARSRGWRASRQVQADARGRSCAGWRLVRERVSGPPHQRSAAAADDEVSVCARRARRGDRGRRPAAAASVEQPKLSSPYHTCDGAVVGVPALRTITAAQLGRSLDAI